MSDKPMPLAPVTTPLTRSLGPVSRYSHAALESIRNIMSVSCHLPREGSFFELVLSVVHLAGMFKGNVRAGQEIYGGGVLPSPQPGCCGSHHISQKTVDVSRTQTLGYVPMKLTQEQIKAFHHDGFLIVRSLFDSEEIELLRKTAREDKVLDDHSFDKDDGEGGSVRLSLRRPRWTRP